MTPRSLLRGRAQAGVAAAAVVLVATTGPALAGQRDRSHREARQVERQQRHADAKAAAGEARPVRTGRGKNAAQAPAKAKSAGGSGKSAQAAPAQQATQATPAPAAIPTPAPAPVVSPAPTPAAAAPAAREATPKPTRSLPRQRALAPKGPTTVPAEPAPTRDVLLGERAARGAPPSEGPADESHSTPVTRTVRELIEVVPEPVKMVLAALGILSLVLGGGYLLTSARARRLARQRSDLLQEVGLLQAALLPPVPEKVGAVRASVAYRPSDGPGAGGDFYDAMTLPGGCAAFILGDVSGHGRAALARTAFMRYTLRAYLEAGLDPRTTLQTAGRVIDEHLGGDFATVVLAVHDPRSGSLTYSCAGHPAPIVVGPGRLEPVMAASSPPIGLGMRTGLRQTTLPLPAGSVACLYTDGLAEARTETGILGRPRLGDIVEELGRDMTAQELIDRVAREARLVTDDMATVVLTPTAGVTAGGFRSEQLEVDAAEAAGDLPSQFLQACGVDERDASSARVETIQLARSHGGAVLHVEYGIRGPRVEVLPRNVESLEAASRRAAMAVT